MALEGNLEMMVPNSIEEPVTISNRQESDECIETPDSDRSVRLRNFLESTTFHGVRYTGTGRRWARLMWTALVLAAWVGFLVQGVNSIVRFASFPTSTNIQIKYPERLKFPAITVCSFNYFLNSSVGDDRVRAALQTMDFLNVFSASFTAENKRILDEAGGWETLTSMAGIKADELIVECVWKVGVQSCSYKNFTKVVTPMGNCFTFDGTDVFTSRGGPGGGLSMVLDVQLKEYLAIGYGTAGIQVLVHPQDEPPDKIYEKGFAAFPGTRTVASIQETRITNLEPPYGDCHDIDLDYHDVYTLSNCFEECKQVLIGEYCSCRELYTSKWYKGSLPVCTFQQFSCVGNGAGVATLLNRNQCYCPIPCSQTVYDVQLSQSLYPAPQLEESFAAALDMSVDYVRRNFIWLDVFYPEIKYTSVVQQEAYTVYNMFGDIGGQLGLFLGASLLTLCELIQYLILEGHAARKRRGRADVKAE